MSYFQKKHKASSSTFSNQIDESSISNCGEQSLAINSSIFNKNNNQSNNKNSYAANQNQGKDSSPISYLKNFKKTYSKANQQNIQYLDAIPKNGTNSKNEAHTKRQYDVIINDIIRGGKNGPKNLKTLSNDSQKSCPLGNKKQLLNNGQRSKRNNDQNCLSRNLFLNDHHQEQSMQQMLNSSINQFQKILQQQRQQQSINKQNNLQQQNIHLKKTLTRFKLILKQKLQNGLNKQKQQMKNMLNQYVQLITKLLHDKEELSMHIEELQNEASLKQTHIMKLEKKNQQINKQKDDHIQKTKLQIDQFLMIIEQFQNQAKQQSQKYQEMDKQLERLKQVQAKFKQLSESSNNKSYSINKKYSSSQYEQQQKRIQIQSEKIQTLLELLQKSQHQTNTLKEILSKQNGQLISLRNQLIQQKSHSKSSHSSSESGLFTQQEVDQMRVYYQQKLEQLQIQHQEEFIQYQKAIKQTISKKDQCIERLNTIINQLRENKKSNVKGHSIDKVREKPSSSPKFVQNNRNKKILQDQDNQNTFNDQQIQEQHRIQF